MEADLGGSGHLIFARDGAERFGGALDQGELRSIKEAVAALPPDRAGVRLHGISEFRPLLGSARGIGSIAASVLGSECHAVRAILFDKTASANWSLGWHQDRTIAVKARIDVPGFGPWSVKHGFVHVEPPFDLLAGMATLRVHLDAVPVANAPLLIAPGSHEFGRIPVGEVAEIVRRCGTVACLADPGDIWLYATPILHASNAAANPGRRRVLQVDFAVGPLPAGLQWLGV